MTCWRNCSRKSIARWFISGSSYEECHGMQTTMSLCWFTPGWMYFGHVGDSRIYHLPGREKPIEATDGRTTRTSAGCCATEKSPTTRRARIRAATCCKRRSAAKTSSWNRRPARWAAARRHISALLGRIDGRNPRPSHRGHPPRERYRLQSGENAGCIRRQKRRARQHHRPGDSGGLNMAAWFSLMEHFEGTSSTSPQSDKIPQLQ